MPGILPFDTINSSAAAITGRRSFREADFAVHDVPHMQGKARAAILQPDHPRYSTTARVPPPPAYGPPSTGGATAPATQTARRQFPNLFNTGSHQQNPMSANGEAQRWPPPERVEPVSVEADFLHRAFVLVCARAAPCARATARQNTNPPTLLPHRFLPS